MKSILVYSFVYILCACSQTDQINDVNILKGFFCELISDNYDGESLLKKYSPQVFNGDAKGDNAVLRKQFAIERLNDLRKKIKSNKFSDLTYTHIKDHPKTKERFIFDSENDLYVIKNNETVVVYIVMKGKIIKSFIAMKKGEQRVFLSL